MVSARKGAQKRWRNPAAASAMKCLMERAGHAQGTPAVTGSLNDIAFLVYVFHGTCIHSGAGIVVGQNDLPSSPR
jgi:hypothetical protein